MLVSHQIRNNGQQGNFANIFRMIRIRLTWLFPHYIQRVGTSVCTHLSSIDADGCKLLRALKTQIAGIVHTNRPLEYACTP